MSSYYNIENVKQVLNNRIAENIAYLEAWKKVNFPTKKDGNPFKVMSKNIEGAVYSDGLNADLTVYTYTHNCGYKNDTINCYEYIRYLKDDNKKNKTENYYNVGYSGYYVYDLDDIKEAVKKHIEYLESYIIELNKQLEAADQIYSEFYTAFENALNVLKNGMENYDHSDIFYMIRDLVIERNSYLG